MDYMSKIMNKPVTHTKKARSSPYFFVTLWSVLLLVSFVPTIPQPDAIIGYLWKTEFALAAFLIFSILFLITQPKGKTIEFAGKEFYLVILPIVLFTIWSGLSCIWAESWRNALHHTLLWACYTVFYILIRQIVSRPKLLDTSLKVSGTVILIIGIACIIEYFTTFQNLVYYFTLRYYKYAEVSVMFLPVYLSLTIKSRDRTAFLPGLISLFAWIIILLSYSRTEFIAGISSVILFFGLVVIFQGYTKYSSKLPLLFLALSIPFLLTQTSLLRQQETSTVERFAANTDQNLSNLQWRFYVWGISLESFKRKPIQGVGADNFVVDYRNAQEDYANSNPQNKLLNLDQMFIAERSHNEYLQILSELGIVGITIFSWLLIGTGIFLLSFRRKKVSLPALASVAGIFAFLVSSLTSSYSFRVPVNGTCFFFLLALLISECLKTQPAEKTAKEKSNLGFFKVNPLLAGCGLLICSTMLLFSAVRGVSLMYLITALETSEKAESEKNYQNAMVLDNQEPLIKYYYGQHLYRNNYADEAVPQLRFAINRGISTPVSYFDLVSAQITAHQNKEAEQTLVEALRVYPRSVFLQTAYASFLKDNGEELKSEVEFNKALQIDSQQAQSWRIAYTQGIGKLAREGIYNKDLLPALDLKPNKAIYALIEFQSKNYPALVKREF